jgi:hypothetical protein
MVPGDLAWAGPLVGWDAAPAHVDPPGGPSRPRQARQNMELPIHFMHIESIAKKIARRVDPAEPRSS